MPLHPTHPPSLAKGRRGWGSIASPFQLFDLPAKWISVAQEQSFKTERRHSKVRAQSLSEEV